MTIKKQYQCDFVYNCFKEIPVSTKTGWFVVVSVDDGDTYNKMPWKPIAGPYSTKLICNEAKAEIFKDVGRPVGLYIDVQRLKKA